MKPKVLPFMVLVVTCVAASGCSRQQEPSMPADGEVSSTNLTSESGSLLTQQDIRVIAPAQSSAETMSPFHKIGEDAVEAITPMPDAEAFVALIGSGDHDVTLTQDVCGFDVEVEVRNEDDASILAVLTLSRSGERTAMLPGSELEIRRVTTRMVTGAENNHDCNVMLRKKL